MTKKMSDARDEAYRRYPLVDGPVYFQDSVGEDWTAEDWDRALANADALRYREVFLAGVAWQAEQYHLAEAKLAKVRAYVDGGLDGMPPDPYDEAQGTLRVIRRLLDGES